MRIAWPLGAVVNLLNNLDHLLSIGIQIHEQESPKKYKYVCQLLNQQQVLITSVFRRIKEIRNKRKQKGLTRTVPGKQGHLLMLDYYYESPCHATSQDKSQVITYQ